MWWVLPVGWSVAALVARFSPAEYEFDRSVTRWRKLLDAKRGDVPLGFLYAWIQKESGGDPTATTTRTALKHGKPAPKSDERGLFQIHAEEAKMLKLSASQWESLRQNKGAEQISIGLRYIAANAAKVNDMLAGTAWPALDKWKLVKLIHVSPGLAKYSFEDFVDTHGRTPGGWTEFAQFTITRKPEKKYRAAAKKWIEGAAWVGTAASQVL